MYGHPLQITKQTPLYITLNTENNIAIVSTQQQCKFFSFWVMMHSKVTNNI